MGRLTTCVGSVNEEVKIFWPFPFFQNEFGVIHELGAVPSFTLSTVPPSHLLAGPFMPFVKICERGQGRSSRGNITPPPPRSRLKILHAQIEMELWG